MENYDYKGWKVPTTLHIFAKKQATFYDYPQAMIASSNKPDALDTAKRWASGHYRDYTEDDYTEYNIENNNIEFELLDSANGSSQGGKLSFWNCIISKDDMKVVIGISSDLLVELLKANDFKKGKCTQGVILARYKGQWGAITENMKEYQEAIKDSKADEYFQKTKKTSKWKQGIEYLSKTKRDTFLYPVYRWYYSKDERHYWSNRIELIVCDKPQKFYLTLDNYTYNKFPKASDLIKYVCEEGHKYYAGSLFSNKYHALQKLPARIEGNKVFEMDISNEELEQFIEEQRNDILQRYRNSTSKSDFDDRNPDNVLDAFAFSLDENKRPEIPEDVIKKLEKDGYIFYKENM